LDILTGAFTNYLTSLNDVSENFDGYRTNLISRFLTTGALKEFDTIGQKMEKVLQILLIKKILRLKLLFYLLHLK
jgi:hypothetical protein